MITTNALLPLAQCQTINCLKVSVKLVQWLCMAFTITLLALTTPAQAHKASDSYLSVTTHQQQLAVRWDIALRDLDNALGLDRNDDRQISWGEVRNQFSQIDAYALARLTIKANADNCIPGQATHALDTHSDGTYYVMQLAMQCPAAFKTLTLDYRLFSDIDPTHRGILRIQHQGRDSPVVLDPNQAAQIIHLEQSAGSSNWHALRQFIWEGMTHIWAGYDHLAFLFALLLPSVLLRKDGGWQAVTHKMTALRDIASVVTAFTCAHSITLALAYLDVVTLPSRWVESAIALTVILAALNNLFPVVLRRQWLVAFLFGLIHGFGFASALKDGAPSTASLLVSLLGFNLGVELGQLLVVAAVLPLILLLRNVHAYARYIMPALSSALGLFGLIWLTERVFDLRIIGI